MNCVLEFSLPGLPKMNSGHTHWTVVGAERKKWRSFVCTLIRFNGLYSQAPLERCALTCTRHSPREPDFDNLVISFKSIIDGLKDAGVIVDDKPSCIVERKYLWVKCPPKKGFVTVRVEER
jgi:Holliday junction resolvase RusA-like endonuclease